MGLIFNCAARHLNKVLFSVHQLNIIFDLMVIAFALKNGSCTQKNVLMNF